MLTAINPATGDIVTEVPCDDASQIEAKLEAAENAFKLWRTMSYAARGDILKAVAKNLRDRMSEMAPIMTVEMGKPIKESRGEVEKAAWCAEHYAEHAESYLAKRVLASDASKSYVQHLPLGVVLGILPWNAPIWLALRFAAPALMAGNTCLMKHDPHVPGTSLLIASAFKAAGAPDGVFDSLFLQTPAVEPVIRDNRIKAVSFTGSSKGGAAVAAIAGSEIKPVVLELGGSDPSIVLNDGDLEKAADTLTLSRIINAGQSCIAAKRIIVEKPVYAEMCDLMLKRLSKLKVGDPSLETTDVGPIAREDLRNTLHRQVTASVDEGATLALGGSLPDGAGFFYPVTLLTDVKPGMSAYCQETFGPVGAIICADDLDHAMYLANDTDYGLAASIWTHPDRGEMLAKDIEAGQVSINGIVKTDPRLPSGGVKKSGLGRELGPHGIHEFVNTQQIWIGPAKPA